jgi:hypothetical protein
MAEVAIASEAVQDVATRLLDTIISGSIYVFVALMMISIIVVVLLWVRHIRKFNIIVELKSLRGSGTKGEPVYKIVDDKGGMIFDKKDKRWWLRLKKERVDLPPPPLDCLEVRADGRNQLKIYQKSQEEYYYLIPDRIDLEYVMKAGKKVPLAQAKLNIVEGDISYWNSLRKRDNRKLFDTESLILKALPYVGMFLMFISIIFLTYIISDHWGTFATAAEALKEAAQALRDANMARLTTG